MHECIAEIGTSHLGSLDSAKQCVDRAKESGAQTVKFQWVIADEIVSPLSGSITLPTGSIDIYNYFKSVEQPFTFYKELQTYVYTQGLGFLCSVFGEQSLTYLHSLHKDGPYKNTPLRIKVASPEINHYPLLHTITELSQDTKVEVILSTGLASLIDVYTAVDVLGDIPLTLLCCVTDYPADPQNYKLVLLEKYKSLFNCRVGLSDHSVHPTLLPSLAIVFGSTVTEKHFTLKKTSPSSPDDPIALDESEFTQMTREVKSIQHLYNTEGRKSVHKLLYTKYGESSVRAITEMKNVTLPRSAAQYRHYEKSRRSLCASADIKKGDFFTSKNTCLVRSEQNLESGISAQMFFYITDKKNLYTSNCNIKKGSLLHYSNLSPVYKTP